MNASHSVTPEAVGSSRPGSFFFLVIILLLVLAAAIAISIVVNARRERTEFLQADVDLILDDPSVSSKTVAKGRDVFVTNCSGCHGVDGRGSTATGTPDLTDQDFLYGTGRASELEQIVLHGIRSGDDKGWNLAWMPAYGQPVPYAREKLPSLSPAEIDQLTSYLREINGIIGEEPTAVAAGSTLFQGHGGCWDCHGHDARGDAGIGAPNLTDGKWLRGDGSRRDINRIIRDGLHGVSPAFRGRLDPVSIRRVAVYVASLHSRGEKE